MSCRTSEGWLLLFACLLGLLLGWMHVAGAETRRLDQASEPSVPTPPADPSLAIYPPQRIPLHFSHLQHQELGVMCVSCHTGAAASAQSMDNLLPKPGACDRCHGTSHAEVAHVKPGPTRLGACVACHEMQTPADNSTRSSLPLPVDLPAPHLLFSHRAHAQRNIGCLQCHGSVLTSALAGRQELPTMQSCLRCHALHGAAQGDAQGDCSTCHVTLPDGRLQTSFASGVLTPPAWQNHAEHGPDFLQRHKRVAADDSHYCATCHSERECMDCHDGRVRPRSVHPNDWLSIHPIAARQDNPRCASCHQEQSFCLTCHERAGVSTTAPRGARGSFHPPQFAELGRGRGSHGGEAERNLNACVSCHTERDCARCHASPGRKGIGIDPHPPGFLGRCGAQLRRNSRPCLVCHEPQDTALSLCR